MPGVIAAVSSADIPGKNDVGPIIHNEPALAADLVEWKLASAGWLLPWLRPAWMPRAQPRNW